MGNPLKPKKKKTGPPSILNSTETEEMEEEMGEVEVELAREELTSEEASSPEEIRRPTHMPSESIPVTPKEDKSKQANVQDLSPMELSSAPLQAKAMQSRTQYPEGENFDNRYEVFNTFVLDGMRDLIKHLKGRTGESYSDLTSIAYIALLEEHGYDMTAFKAKLQPYYALKEMQEKLKKFEEAQAKNQARRKKKED